MEDELVRERLRELENQVSHQQSEIELLKERVASLADQLKQNVKDQPGSKTERLSNTPRVIDGPSVPKTKKELQP